MFTSLANVIARRTPVEWFEAVAIVQTVAKNLLDEPAASRSLPDFDGIALMSEGQVVVMEPGTGEANAVKVLGRLLNALLPPTDMPRPLRLLASSAESASPSVPDLRALVQALSYFERPDLPVLIQAVYQRWLLLPPEETCEPAAVRGRAAAEVPPAARQLQELEEGTPAEAVADRAGQSHGPMPEKWLPLVVACIVVLALAGIGLLWTTVTPPAQANGAPSSNAAAALPVPPAPPPAWFTTAAPALPLVVPPGEEQAERIRPIAPPRRQAAEPGRSPMRLAAADGRASSRLAASTPAATDAATPAPQRREALSPRPPAAPAPTGQPAASGAPAAAIIASVDETVYSAEDRDVVPPVLLRAMQPTASRRGTRPEDLPLVELLISKSGEVDSLRLVRPTDDVLTWVNLSVVKSWRYRPATRNGRPVRYRQTVRLTDR